MMASTLGRACNVVVTVAAIVMVMVMFSSVLAAANVTASSVTEAANDKANVPGQVAVISVRNGFPTKTEIKCVSDKEFHFEHVWPNAPAAYPFDPLKHEYWVCEIWNPDTPAYGQFKLYSRIISRTFCTPICDWRADPAGMWVPLHVGDKPTLIFHWK